MPHRLIAALALTAALTLSAVAVAVAAPAKEAFALKGEVYANYKIEMKTSANRTLKTVKAGRYRIKIEDHSSIHDFHLVGPGLDKTTTVGGTGERFWTVTLRSGTYRFFCDPHAGQMHGSFRVT